MTWLALWVHGDNKMPKEFFRTQPPLSPGSIELKNIELTITAPEEITNYFINPSFEAGDDGVMYVGGNGSRAIGTGDQTQGAAALKQTAALAAGIDYLTGATNQSVVPNTTLIPQGPYTGVWSFDIQGSPGDRFLAQVERLNTIHTFSATIGYANFSTGSVIGTWPTDTTNKWISSSSNANNDRIGFQHNATLPADPGNSQMEYVVRGQLSFGANNSYPNVIFRYVDINNFLFLKLDSAAAGSNQGRLSIGKMVAGTPSILQTFMLGVDLLDDTRYTLTIVPNNSLITMYVAGPGMGYMQTAYTYTLAGGDAVTFASTVPSYGGAFLQKVGTPTSTARWLIWRWSKGIGPGQPQTIYASRVITLNGAIDRNKVTFEVPNLNKEALGFRLLRLNNTPGTWSTDAWQLEQNSAGYARSYIDGSRPGAIWLGLAHNSYSYKPETQPGGRDYVLADQVIRVLSILDYGLPIPINATLPNGLSGGQTYQQTTDGPKVYTVSIRLDTKDQYELHKARERLVDIVSYHNRERAAKPLLLKYQVLNCGQAVSKLLQVPVYYAGGLEGTAVSHKSDAFQVKFVELAPPSIIEPYQEYAALGTVNTTATYNPIQRRINGVWTPYTVYPNQVFALAYNNNNVLAFGGTDAAGLITGANYPADFQTITGTGAFCIQFMSDGSSYVGGLFTVPFTNFYKGNSQLGGVSATSTNPNGAVRGICLGNTITNLHIVGDFTNVATRHAIYNTLANSYTAIGTGLNNTGRCCCIGPNGNAVVGGDFTTANGVTVNGVAEVNATATSYNAFSSGVAGGNVFCMVLGPDNKLYIGGSFTSAGGVTCNRIARWNGTNWEPLGLGFSNGTVLGLSFDQNGNLYAVGSFTASTGSVITRFIALWDGSNWRLVDIILPSGTTQLNAVIAPSKNNPQTLAIAGTTSGAATVYRAAQTTINYGGTADASLKMVFTCSAGAWPVYSITNTRTGRAIYFNKSFVTGESATLDLTPGNISFVNNLNQNILGPATIEEISNFVQFGLLPGNNTLSVLAGDTGTGTIEVYYNNTHHSFDAVGV